MITRKLNMFISAAIQFFVHYSRANRSVPKNVDQFIS